MMGDEHNGMFIIPVRGEEYSVLASNGMGWEHVSVASKKKIPAWKDMCIIKEMFFEDNEVVMQLHPAKSDYVNNHPNCLHLWRPVNQAIPLPPKECV